MNYSIDSIELKYCLKTNKECLELIKVCEICDRIPLPYYINKGSKNIYCQKCYISVFKNRENTEDIDAGA